MKPIAIARRPKYGAVPTTVDGLRFHSAKEARRYSELRLLERAGQIRGLECQPRFPLAVAGATIGVYIADFRYGEVATGQDCVEDVKGVRTPLYRWKKRHVAAQYGIQIREV